jgi:hypothetical protein
MITISLRIFPSSIGGRRVSFISKEIKINKATATVKDIFDIEKDLSIDSYKLARGITFLKLENTIENGDSINAIPY